MTTSPDRIAEGKLIVQLLRAGKLLAAIRLATR